MSWDRFHYICRRYIQQESLHLTLQEISEQNNTQLYAGADNKHLSTNLLKELAAISDSEVRLKAVKIYAQMDLSCFLSIPLKLRRMTSYATYLAVVFFIISAAFQFQVIPSFVAFFAEYNIKPPASFVWLSDYWAVLSSSVLLMLIVTVYLGLQIKSVFNFTSSANVSFIARMLLSKNIKRLHSQIHTLIRIPIDCAHKDNAKGGNSQWYDHLSSYADNDLFAKELTVLLKAQGAQLTKTCEKFLQFLNVLLVLVIIFSILSFLQGAYSPIFALGEVL